MANSVPIIPCSIQALPCGSLSNPTAAQRQDFCKTSIVQGVQMGITENISLPEAHLQ